MRGTGRTATAGLLLAAAVSACGGSSGGTAYGGGGQGSSASTSQSAQGAASGSASATPKPRQTESNPPGDIPDNQVFVPYSPPGAAFTVKVPEGWARSVKGGVTTFTDKLNSVAMSQSTAASAPTVASFRRDELPTLKRATSHYFAGQVSTVRRRAGNAVLATYFADSAPDPVTDKVVRDAVERYEFWHGGHLVVLTLSGPKGADNVDPWKTVTDSLRWK